MFGVLTVFSVFSYAYVRALSDVRSLVSSVEAITFDGVGQSRSFGARSIAYDPRTLLPEGFFFGTGPSP